MYRKSTAVGLVVPSCSCTTQTDDDIAVEDVRKMSDTFCASGDEPTDVGASNMVWAWVRFLQVVGNRVLCTGVSAPWHLADLMHCLENI